MQIDSVDARADSIGESEQGDPRVVHGFGSPDEIA